MRNGILLVSFLAACSSGGDGGGIANPSSFDAQSALASCQQAARCGFIGASEEKQCESDAAATAKAYPPVYSTTEAVNAKRLAFDGAAAQACVDANKNAGCSIDAYFSYSLYLKCAHVFKPLVMPGGACKASGECVNGWCDQGTNGQTGCSGTCKANDATGAACDPQGAHCSDTDYCDSTTMKCAPRAKLGEACGDSPQCTNDLFCKGFIPADATTMTPETKGTCKGGGAVGDDCTLYFFGNDDCGDGLFCDDSGASPKCAKPAPMGGDCSSYYGCVDPLDCIGLSFDQNTGAVSTKGKCGAWLDIGKSCDPTSTGEIGCPLDSTCDNTTKTCTVGGQLGADCDTSGFGASCGTNLYCDGPTAKCAKALALGSACTAPAVDMDGNPIGADPCHDGSCTGGTCTLVCM